MQRLYSSSHLLLFIFPHIFPFQNRSFYSAIPSLCHNLQYPPSVFLPKHSGRLRGSFVATLCGRLGQALRSDTYAGFREGQLTLVNIAGVSGELKGALPTLRQRNPGVFRVPLPKLYLIIPRCESQSPVPPAVSHPPDSVPLSSDRMHPSPSGMQLHHGYFPVLPSA